MERLLDVAELQPQDWPRQASSTVFSVVYTLYNVTLGERQTCLVLCGCLLPEKLCLTQDEDMC